MLDLIISTTSGLTCKMTFLKLPDTGTSVLGGDGGGVVAYAYQKYPGSTKVVGEEQGLTAFAS